MAMRHIGGKLLIFNACIPSAGEAQLKSNRENTRFYGTDQEVELLRPVSQDYGELATDLTKGQISVELFLAPQSYMDVASITPLAKLTGGDCRYYGPGFQIHDQGLKLKNELVHVLSRYMGWEAVMKIRTPKGWKIDDFFGHHYLKGQGLIVVPNCHADQTFTVTVSVDPDVDFSWPDPVVCVQGALLYTNSDGERRIRVHTWAAVTTQNQNEVLQSIDVPAIATLMAQISLNESLKSNLAQGRNKIQTQCQQAVQAQSAVPSCEALQMLPIYLLGMLKSTAFRATSDVSADVRTAVWTRLEALPVAQVARYFYPRLVAVHNADCAAPDEYGRVELPPLLNLTSESLSQDGVYMLEDGESVLIWVGQGVDPTFLQAVFGAPSFDQLDPAQAEAVIEAAVAAEQPCSNAVAATLRQLRAEPVVPYLRAFVVRQGSGDSKEMKFFASLIEDRTPGMQTTYAEFLSRMGYRPPPGPPSAPLGASQPPPPAYRR